MRRRPTLIFFVIVALLSAWFFLVEKPADESRRANAILPYLCDVALDGATSIHVERPADTLSLVIVDTHWELESPVRDVAYQGAVGRLLKVLAEARIERDIGWQGDPARFGLAPPAAVITIRSSGDTLLSLHVGNFTVDKRSVYVRHAKERRVLLAPTGIRRAALYDLEDWRNRRVVNFDLSTVTEYTVDGPGGSMRWFRLGSTWRTVSGRDTLLGDTEAVEAILRRIRGLRVRRFPEPHEYGDRFTTARRRVEIVKEPPHPEAHFAVIWGDAGYPMVKTYDDGRVVETDSAITGVFEPGVWDLRDKRPLRFEPIDVRRIEFTTPDTTATIVLRGSEWTSPNPSVSRLDQRRVAILLRSIASLNYDTPPRQEPPPSGDVLFRLALYGSDATIIDELTCYEGDAPGVWTSYSSSAGMTTISSESVQRLVERLRLTRRPESP